MYNLSDFVEEVNKKLETAGVDSKVNERLVRHYTTEKLVPVPLKEGKEARYTEQHVDALVSLRCSQQAGLTTKALKSISDGYDTSSLLNSSGTRGYSSSASGQTSNSALSFLKSLDTPVVAKRSLMSQPADLMGNAVFGACMPSAVGAVAANYETVASAVVNESWSRLTIKDGLEINIRSDVKQALDAADIDLVVKTLNNLK